MYKNFITQEYPAQVSGAGSIDCHRISIVSGTPAFNRPHRPPEKFRMPYLKKFEPTFTTNLRESNLSSNGNWNSSQNNYGSRRGGKNYFERHRETSSKQKQITSAQGNK